MDTKDKIVAPAVNDNIDEDSFPAKNNKPKPRGKKRKRCNSESSSDLDDVLPENILEMEKNLHASALKNNLDDVSVKKILKKVVTNDHVLALVKLREEEEAEDSGTEEKNLQPKLTRAKFKELMKVSPKTGPWNLELTPIKHIPVKTRPEVKALIAQELPEDEDDEEYKPTHEDVQSDDDQTLESCSDLESQPATPATPSSTHAASPQVLKDGPFKVPQMSTPVRRKLIIDEEEATIALRTRSKLSLSATPIEHIESSFVPPDDIAPPDVEDPVWNEFLNECLDPTSANRTEEDDDADPEYNVAADPDAHDEDEEALESSIIKISKKELNDLVTELFSIMPEASVEDALAENLANDVLTINPRSEEVTTHWEGKQEPLSDEEANQQALRISYERRTSQTRVSIGKIEPPELECVETIDNAQNKQESNAKKKKLETPKKRSLVNISVEEENRDIAMAESNKNPPPPLLRGMQAAKTNRTSIQIAEEACILPEQVLILQQQLRQHIQLTASNFLQLYVNPGHWSYAPTYKEYLEQFKKIVDENPNSVVNVCNLKPAIDLCESWEKSVSEDTPENKQMVEFIQKEADRWRRRFRQNCIYVGRFHETFMNVVANSPVFLYPYLLPAMPYRADNIRRFGYRRSEDNLIVLGLDQFWQYVEDNPQLFKPPTKTNPRQRWGLGITMELVCKHMMPWFTPRWLLGHVHRARKDKDNPIAKFFDRREVQPVEHKLLPFNPNLTLYEQPEHEMPRIWIRYLSKSSRRFRDYFFRRTGSGQLPKGGIPINVACNVDTPTKTPLPIDFTKPIISNRANVRPKEPTEPTHDKFDLQIDGSVGSITASDIENSTEGNNTILSNNTAENIAIGNIATPDCVSGNIVVVDKIGGKVLGNLIPLQQFTGTITDVANNESGNVMINPTSEEVLQISVSDATNACIDNNTSTVNMVIGEATTITSINNDTTSINEGTVTATDKTYLMPSNMYKVVETSTGAFLVPMTQVKTNTVNCISSPISSTVAANTTVPNYTSIESGVDQELRNHCKCCILLRKICKVKQTLITDFFKTKTDPKKCECSNKSYPKISKRLKLLVNNYKCNSWCVYRKLQSQLNLVNKNKNRKCEVQKDDNFDLDDIATVTSYQLKLTVRSNIIRNTYVKKFIHNQFSKFDVDSGDPVGLAQRLEKSFDVEMVDLYKEFLGFLTAEQADKMGEFKEYFIQACAGELIKKIETEVTDEVEKHKILKTQLNAIYNDSESTPCEMCFAILDSMHSYPELAKYVFSLFPHRSTQKDDKNNQTKNKQTPLKIAPLVQEAMERAEIEIPAVERDFEQVEGALTICSEPLARVDYEADTAPRKKQTTKKEETPLKKTRLKKTPLKKTPLKKTPLKKTPLKKTPLKKTPLVQEAMERAEIEIQSVEQDLEQVEGTLTICAEPLARVDCEANASPSDSDNNNTEAEPDRKFLRRSTRRTGDIKSESPPRNHILDTPELTISKTEIQRYATTDISITRESDTEIIKSEAPDWKREDDKVILEALMQYLTPHGRKDKTILEVIEENNVYQTLVDSLSDKSIDDVQERVLYLLEILVLSDY